MWHKEFALVRRLVLIVLLAGVFGGLLGYRAAGSMQATLTRQSSVIQFTDLLGTVFSPFLPKRSETKSPPWLQELAKVPLVAPGQMRAQPPPLVIHPRRVEEAILCRNVRCYDI